MNQKLAEKIPSPLLSKLEKVYGISSHGIGEDLTFTSGISHRFLIKRMNDVWSSIDVARSPRKKIFSLRIDQSGVIDVSEDESVDAGFSWVKGGLPDGSVLIWEPSAQEKSLPIARARIGDAVSNLPRQEHQSDTNALAREMIGGWLDQETGRIYEQYKSDIELELDQALMERNARTRLIEEKGGLLNGTQVHAITGSKSKNKASTAKRMLSSGKIFSVNVGTSTLYPRYQFDEYGKPYSGVAQVLKAFDGRRSGWELALWLVNPNSYLNEHEPIDLIRTDDTDIVLEAVDHEFAPEVH